MDKDMKRILTSMILPRLEYAAVVWSPNAKKDIRKLERIQSCHKNYTRIKGANI